MNLFPKVSESHQGQVCGRFLHRNPERPLDKAVEIKPGCWRPHIWRSQSCGISAKESCIQTVEAAQERDGHYRQQSVWKDRATYIL